MSPGPWDDPGGISRPGFEAFTTAMVTGHRPKRLTPGESAWSQVALTRTVWRLRSVYEVQHALTGMALGADTWWALAALACGMHLHAHIPFEDQPARWGEADRETWRELRRRARTETVVGGKHYDVSMLHARNDAMLDATEQAHGLVVALCKPDATGGTAAVVAKARDRGIALLLLDPQARTVRRSGW